MTTKQEITAEELKAESLMIGNQIMINGNQCGEVVEIRHSSARVTYFRMDKYGERHTSIIDNEHLSGIPLSPEILERCGFDYDTVTYCRNNMLLAPSKNGFDVFFNGLTNGPVSHVTYLHELQNIVKSITGKDLTVTP